MVLFDPGSTKSFISRKAILRVAHIILLANAKKVTTLAESMQTSELVKLHDIILPELIKTDKLASRRLSFSIENVVMTSFEEQTSLISPTYTLTIALRPRIVLKMSDP